MISKLREDLVSAHKDFLQGKNFIEFGVFQGKSLLEFYSLYEKYNISNVEFYGLDSFVGLPKEEQDKFNPSYWDEGAFNNEGNINPELLNKERVKILDGWFNKTLTNEFAASLQGKKFGIIHVDCDIYTSAFEALDFCFKHDLVAPVL